jgi:DNA-binding transcriptional MerR regulator
MHTRRQITIKAAETELGVSQGILRRLERTGQIPEAARHPVNGYRLYSPALLRATKRALVGLGYTKTERTYRPLEEGEQPLRRKCPDCGDIHQALDLTDSHGLTECRACGVRYWTNAA